MEQELDTKIAPGELSHDGSATSGEESGESTLNKAAMEGAKRAEHRIRADEPSIPGDSIFTK